MSQREPAASALMQQSVVQRQVMVLDSTGVPSAYEAPKTDNSTVPILPAGGAVRNTLTM